MTLAPAIPCSELGPVVGEFLSALTLICELQDI